MVPAVLFVLRVVITDVLETGCAVVLFNVGITVILVDSGVLEIVVLDAMDC